MEDPTFGFAKAIGFNHGFLTHKASEPVREAFDAFKSNISRIDSLMLAPIYISFFSGLFERMRCAGEVRVTNKIVMPGIGEDHDISEAAAESVVEAAKEIRSEYFRKWKGKERELTIFSLNMGIHGVEQVMVTAALSQGESNPVMDGVGSVFASMIVNAWTAFEVLAEDLWVSALNARPRLGFRAINAEIKDKESEEDREKRLNKCFEIPAWMIQEDPNFNIHNNMGTLLREQFDFRKRAKVIDAYTAVFFDNPYKSNVRRILSDPKLDWVSAVRHAIVHYGGKVYKSRISRSFKGLVAAHTELGKLEPGDMIPINGDLVCELVTVVVNSGIELLDFVDGWIKNNPR
jgi:hypothetical protein